MRTATRPMIAALVAALLAILAACGSGGEGPPGAGAATIPPTEATGTIDDPAELTLGQSFAASVSDAYYLRFSTAQSGDYGAVLSGAVSDVAWRLFDNAGFDGEPFLACDSVAGAGDEACSTPSLPSATMYYLEVRSVAATPSAFTIRVDKGLGIGTAEDPASYSFDGVTAPAIPILSVGTGSTYLRISYLGSTDISHNLILEIQNLSGDADLYAYPGPEFATAWCSSTNAGTTVETCQLPFPNPFIGPEVYLRVDGSKSAAGVTFDLSLGTVCIC